MASTAMLALLVVVLLPPITLAGDVPGFRATLTRIQPYSPGKQYSAAVRRDSHRLAFLSYASAVGAGRAATNSSTSIQALLEKRPGMGSYRMNVSVGTPPFTFPAVVDTGSDLTWTQCAPCTKCFPQPTPLLFQPASSSSFSKLSCNSSFCQSLPTSFRTCNATGCVYDYRYGKGYTNGYLAAETLTVGGHSFSNFAFGCSTENGVGNSSGIVGLARTPLSLVSQLGVGRFSYCLRSDAGASPILFGSLAKVTGGKVQTTPFVKHPADPASSFYYVNLTGITVGSTDLPVTSSTFGFSLTGSSGGTVVDSGTTLTYLAEAGYAMVKQSFQSQMVGNVTMVTGERAGGLDLCFEVNGGDVGVPSLVLRFAEGADYDVPLRGYIGAVELDSQGRVSVACLLLLPEKDMSIIGNVLQMDLHVLYDLDGEKFSFAPADCAKV